MDQKRVAGEKSTEYIKKWDDIRIGNRFYCLLHD